MVKTKRRPRPAAVNTEPSVERVIVTPQLATEWLKQNKNNRSCPKTAVTRLVTAIHSGEWEENCETIKFNPSGVLTDGQTRLAAIVIACKSVVCWVARNVPKAAEDTFGQGRPRSIADILECNGYHQYKILAGAIRYLYSRDGSIPQEPGGIRISTALSIVRERPELVNSCRKVNTLVMRRVASAPTAAAQHYMMSRKDPTLADKFWDDVAGDAHGQRNPILVLRDLMICNKERTERKLSNTAIAALTIKAWNLVRAGKTCTRLKWNSENEPFPEIK